MLFVLHNQKLNIRRATRASSSRIVQGHARATYTTEASRLARLLHLLPEWRYREEVQQNVVIRFEDNNSLIVLSIAKAFGDFVIWKITSVADLLTQER